MTLTTQLKVFEQQLVCHFLCKVPEPDELVCSEGGCKQSQTQGFWFQQQRCACACERLHGLTKLFAVGQAVEELGQDARKVLLQHGTEAPFTGQTANGYSYDSHVLVDWQDGSLDQYSAAWCQEPAARKLIFGSKLKGLTFYYNFFHSCQLVKDLADQMSLWQDFFQSCFAFQGWFLKSSLRETPRLFTPVDWKYSCPLKSDSEYFTYPISALSSLSSILSVDFEPLYCAERYVQSVTSSALLSPFFWPSVG